MKKKRELKRSYCFGKRSRAVSNSEWVFSPGQTRPFWSHCIHPAANESSTDLCENVCLLLHNLPDQLNFNQYMLKYLIDWYSVDEIIFRCRQTARIVRLKSNKSIPCLSGVITWSAWPSPTPPSCPASVCRRGRAGANRHVPCTTPVGRASLRGEERRDRERWLIMRIIHWYLSVWFVNVILKLSMVLSDFDTHREVGNGSMARRILSLSEKFKNQLRKINHNYFLRYNEETWLISNRSNKLIRRGFRRTLLHDRDSVWDAIVVDEAPHEPPAPAAGLVQINMASTWGEGWGWKHFYGITNKC